MSDTELFQRYIRPLAPLPTGVTPDLAGLRPFAALLCDVYGTLLISAAGDIGQGQPFLPSAALSELLRRHGIDRTPERLMDDLHHAIARRHAEDRRRGVDWPEVDMVRIWQEVLGETNASRAAAFALAYELIVNPVYPMPGLPDLLAHHRRRQTRMGIISNAQFFTPWQLVYFLGAPLDALGFDSRLLFYSWQWGRAKPSDMMFARANAVLGAMGVPAESVLYVGNDMRNDILPAKRVGFQTALFAGDRRSLRLRSDDADCRGLRADLVVTDLRQLIV
jgi:putative hydrolase of the HAD superfamily